MPYTDGEIETRITRDFAQSTAARSRIFFEAPYSTADVDATRDAYDAAIARIDAALGRLLDGVPAQSIVVVLADHGESLGEHGLYFAHDFSLYDELLRVPLMLRAPGVAPAIDSTAVSLIDVLPTICALADLDCPDDLDGIRLPRTGGDDDPSPFSRRTLYAASAPARSRYRCPWLVVPGIEGRLTMALTGQRKLIRIPTPTGPTYRAYDLGADPAESVDRFDAGDDHALAADLSAWSASAVTRPSAPTQLPKTVTRELRSLGYLE
jgi:choline-sulfatase